jgi:hypothetical protein
MVGRIPENDVNFFEEFQAQVLLTSQSLRGVIYNGLPDKESALADHSVGVAANHIET